MAATTITRATITDDSGNGTSGTIINSAWVGTALYDKIDALFTSTTLQQEGSNSGGSITYRVKNSHTTGFASVVLATNASDGAASFNAFGATYSTADTAIASSARVLSTLSAGLSLAATSATGAIRFYSGGNANPMTLAATGHLVLTEQTTNPGTSELAADAAVSVYTKADKLVFAYNNGGTMTYITLDLDGSDTTLAHGTSAP